MELNQKEKDVLQHALCGGQNKNPYRNRFITGPGSKDFPIVEGLVGKGMMIKREFSFNENDTEFFYWVTENGAKSIGLTLPQEKGGG